MLFPEKPPYRVPNNPFRGPISEGLSKMHKKALQDALRSVRGPFLFDSVEPYKFDGTCVGADTPSESFNSAVATVIAAIERGFCSNRDPAPLGARDWARLSSALLAAVGRGYHRQFTLDHENELGKIKAEAIDPDPLAKAYPTFFHRLSATAEDVALHLGTDAREEPDGYQEWYSTLKINFTRKATKAAAAEVDEKWLTWKANELDRLAETFQSEIASKAREKGTRYFIDMAERLGLQITSEGIPADATSIPQTGRKRTASGSTPKPTPVVPPTPLPTRVNPPRAAKRTNSNSPARRGRELTPSPQPTAQADLSLTPRPRKRSVVSPTTPESNLSKVTPDQPDAAALTTTVLTKILARLEALEKLSMPPPAKLPETRSRPAPTPDIPQVEPTPYSNTGETLPVLQPAEEQESEFTPVTRNRRSRKGKEKMTPPQINLTPASYASAAASAASTQQPTAPPKAAARLPAITEVTVLRSGTGGHIDPQIEMSIRARPADAIVREVRLKMGNTVANPIPLRAGRWSAHPRSKGNFVYSFDGNIHFDLIESYKRILLAPFHGSGKLSPSMGWTRLLAHGVPVFDESWTPSGPDALLKEVKAMPGLKRAHFAMPPRWLKPVGRIESNYSTITFAISDPDGSITNTLLNGRAALFGKEVEIQRWVDKPALIQCSHCHALGHIKTSRACPLGKDSAKCFICGGSHKSEKHDQKCNRRHAVAGICDCKHFKCLNCQNTGHTCRDTRCPARDLFRPRTSRRPRKPKGSGRNKDWAPNEEPDTAPANATLVDLLDAEEDEDLYSPAPLPPNPTSRKMRTAVHHQGIANICNSLSKSWTDEQGASGSDSRIEYESYDPEEFPEAWNCPEPMDMDLATARPMEYSPSRPQGDTTKSNLA